MLAARTGKVLTSKLFFSNSHNSCHLEAKAQHVQQYLGQPSCPLQKSMLPKKVVEENLARRRMPAAMTSNFL
jgi:hypothetical protein